MGGGDFGRLPIVAARAGEGDAALIASLAARHALMRMCGVKADLVFLTSDGGDYHRRTSRAVSRALAAAGLDSLLGSRGGIHCARRRYASAGGALGRRAARRRGAA